MIELVLSIAWVLMIALVLSIVAWVLMIISFKYSMGVNDSMGDKYSISFKYSMGVNDRISFKDSMGDKYSIIVLVLS